MVVDQTLQRASCTSGTSHLTVKPSLPILKTLTATQNQLNKWGSHQSRNLENYDRWLSINLQLCDTQVHPTRTPTMTWILTHFFLSKAKLQHTNQNEQFVFCRLVVVVVIFRAIKFQMTFINRNKWVRVPKTRLPALVSGSDSTCSQSHQVRMLGMIRRNMLFDFQLGRSTSNWEPHPRRLHWGSPRFQQRTFAECVNSTPTYTARTKLHSMITFHNANKRGSRAGRLRIAHLCVLKRVMSHSLPHMTLTTSTSSLWRTSPFFPTISPTHTRPSVHEPDLPREVPRQSGGSTQIPSLTGYEPNAIEAEAIEPEDPEPRRIELDRNLGTDPYQIQEIFSRNNFQYPITEDMDEFGKVGAEMSHISHRCIPIMTQRKALQTRILNMENYEKCWLHHCLCKVERTVIISNANCIGKPAAMIQERGASAKRTQADLREGLCQVRLRNREHRRNLLQCFIREQVTGKTVREFHF